MIIAPYVLRNCANAKLEFFIYMTSKDVKKCGTIIMRKKYQLPATF
jgi:hypothetical protein